MAEELLAEQELDCGAIVRTVAEGADKDALAADLRYTLKLWAVVKERCNERGAKSLIHEDLSPPLRAAGGALWTYWAWAVYSAVCRV